MNNIVIVDLSNIGIKKDVNNIAPPVDIVSKNDALSEQSAPVYNTITQSVITVEK